MSLEPARGRTFIKSIVCGTATDLFGDRVVVGGWVKTGRAQGRGTFAFLELNDGSCGANLQAIVDASVWPLDQLVPTGTCVLVEGELKKPPEGVKQTVELRVDRVLEIGTVDPTTYPLPKAQLGLDNVRSLVHLRARTNIISAVTRISDELAYATHTFFRENGFRYIRTPIITTNDCEGGSQMFQVTTLFNDAAKPEKDLKENPVPSEPEVATGCSTSSEGESRDVTAVSVETKAPEHLARSVERFNLKPVVQMKDGKIDCSHDFFGRQAFLTVSGQLHVETYACAVGNVYTFGPTFRAENSNSTRHLAEFWMVEPEIAFANLEDDMNYAEKYVKFLCKWLLDHSRQDLELIVKRCDKTAIERLQLVSSTPFERISYTEAVELLANVTDKEFENKVYWGVDLQTDHERYLTEVIFKKPVIVYNYPRKIKAFYMRLNDDNKTVAAMDVLVPKVGELIGGSQREERLEVLKERIIEKKLSPEAYEWYLDLRRHGTVKHSGFGLGFERMILFATGLDTIRDVIPFPRCPGRADL